MLVPDKPPEDALLGAYFSPSRQELRNPDGQRSTW